MSNPSSVSEILARVKRIGQCQASYNSENDVMELPVHDYTFLVDQLRTALQDVQRKEAQVRQWRWLHWGQEKSWVCECGNANGSGVDHCPDCTMQQPRNPQGEALKTRRPAQPTTEQVEHAARAICDEWGYDWDCNDPEDGQCCGDDENLYDERPSKELFRRAGKAALSAALSSPEGASR